MHWLSNDDSFFHIVSPIQKVFIASNSTSSATPISFAISQPKNAAERKLKVRVVHCKILQSRILEWVGFPFSRGSSQPRDQTQVSHVAGRFFTSWATREAQESWSGYPISSSWIFLIQEWNQGLQHCRQADSLPTELSVKPPPPAKKKKKCSCEFKAIHSSIWFHLEHTHTWNI